MHVEHTQNFIMSYAKYCLKSYAHAEFNLNVLSNEIDLDKSGLTQKVIIKGSGAEIFRKFIPPPYSEILLKCLSASLFFLLAIWKPI